MCESESVYVSEGEGGVSEREGKECLWARESVCERER